MSAAADSRNRSTEASSTRADPAPTVPTASEAVRQSKQRGWSNVELPELRAAYAWYETKSAQETSSWPITTAVVGSAAVATAYLIEHGLGGWDSVGGALVYLIATVAALCASLTIYRLFAIWRYEREYAEVVYWQARREPDSPK